MSGKPRIGLVDPKEDSNLLCELDASQALDVTRVRATNEALALLTAGVNCLVSVAELPDSDGLTLFERVRKRDSEAGFVLTPRMGTDNLANRAIESGVDDYLPRDIYRVETIVERVVSLAKAKYRRRSLEALERTPAESHNLLEAISTTYPDSMYVYSETGEYLDVLIGRQRAELTSPESLLGRCVDDVLSPETAERLQEGIDAALETGELQLLEYSITAENRTHCFEGALSRIPGGYLGENAVLCSVRDITERQERKRKRERTKAELKASNEKLERFAYVASHDLQEPLGMISKYMRALETELSEDLEDDSQDYVTLAMNSADRLRRMIDSLLEYSQVQSQAAPFEPVDANVILSIVEHDLEFRLAASDAQFTVEDLPTIEADADQLGQVFRNLIANAVEHGSEDENGRASVGKTPPESTETERSAAGPRIEVTASESEDMVEFCVRDDGPGLPEEQQEEMFELFEKGLESAGSGMGLAICEEIVDRHGGDIWIESTVGEGTAIYFTIPQR